MVVKYSTFSDPNLAKVVKYSTLAILFSSYLFQPFICEAGKIVRRVFFKWGAPEILEKFDLASRREIYLRSSLAYLFQLSIYQILEILEMIYDEIHYFVLKAKYSLEGRIW